MRLANQMSDYLSFGIMAIDTHYRITALNKVGANILQVDQKQAIGQNVFELFPDAPMEVRHVERTVLSGEEFELNAMPYQWGPYRLFLSLKTRALMENGERVGALAEFQDVTDYYEKRQGLITRMEDMAVTVIPVTSNIALFPLQPIIDDLEFHYILDRAIEKIAKMNMKDLIIDFSAIRTVHADLIQKAEKLIQTVKLIGIHVTLTGIQPEVAKEWMKHYNHLSNVKIYQTLQAAVEVIYDHPSKV